MDDDGGLRVAKAGRRAARKVDTWGDGAVEPSTQQAFGLDAGFAGPSGNGSGGGEAGDGGGVDGWGASRPRPSAAGDRGPPAPGSRPLPPPDDDALPSPPARLRAGADSPRAVPPSQPGSRMQPSSGPKAPPPDLLAEPDSKKFVGVSRRKQEQIARGDDDVSRKNLKYEEKLTAGADGIMDIPELEEEGREDLSNVVAEAPKVRVQKVQGMDQLEEDMHFKLPSTDDRDIDLSLLTAVLCSSEQVNEPEDVWDPDIILTEVGSALYSEKEKAEEADKQEQDKDPNGI